MPYWLVFLIGILVLLFFVVKLRTNAFIGLLATTFTIGALSGMPLLDVVSTISEGFGGTVASIGLVIIFGTILGKYLEVTNSTDKMAVDMVGLFGEKNTALAMALSGYVISIPVFSDSAMVILSPLILALAAKNKKPRTAIAVLGVSLAAGLLSTNVFVPPTPGPLAAAGMLGIDIGQAMFFGAIVALFRTVFGWLYAQFYLAKKDEDWFTYEREPEERFEASEIIGTDKMPSTIAAILPLLVPLILILTNTATAMVVPEDAAILGVTSFIGDPIIALVIGCIVAMILHVGTLKKEGILKVLDSGMKESGSIVFVVAAGGALGRMLSTSGVGDALAQYVAGLNVPALLIPFLIGATIKLVNGSGTTALITAVSITLPMMDVLGLHPVVVFLAAASGASIASHVNDSFFWVYAENLGMDMNTGLKTLTASNLVSTIGSLIGTFLVSLFL